MGVTTILFLVKARLGISSEVRASFLLAIIESVIAELEGEKGLVLDEANPNHLMFVVDYSSWRYESKGKDGGTPRHLQFRLHNLMINNRGVDNV